MMRAITWVNDAGEATTTIDESRCPYCRFQGFIDTDVTSVTCTATVPRGAISAPDLFREMHRFERGAAAAAQG